MHLWAPYITRSTCCSANSKISFISVSCKISTEKWRPRVLLVFCSRFFYAPSNDWNSTQHWFVSQVVGLHHWIRWRLKFFCWKSSALQSGWLETQLDDGTRFSFRQWNTPLPFCYCNTCRGNGMLIQASCPASLQGGIHIHGDAWKGILIQASPPASLRGSCGCLEWDPHSCILSSASLRGGIGICVFRGKISQMIRHECLFCRWSPYF